MAPFAPAPVAGDPDVAGRRTLDDHLRLGRRRSCLDDNILHWRWSLLNNHGRRRRVLPESIEYNKTSIASLPMRWNPGCARARGQIPMPGGPEIAIISLVPLAGNPDVVWRGLRGDGSFNGRWQRLGHNGSGPCRSLQKTKHKPDDAELRRKREFIHCSHRLIFR